MKKQVTKLLGMMLCMGMIVLLAPIVSRAEENGTIPENQTTNVVSAPTDASTSDVWISNFQQWKTNRVIFGNEAASKKGGKGVQIQVSQVKDGKVVYEKEDFQVSTEAMNARPGVAYRYRIRYYNKDGYGSDAAKVYGNWSGYRYFAMPAISGKRTVSAIKIKLKKMDCIKGYDVFLKIVKGAKSPQGKMMLGVSPIKNFKATGWKKTKTLGKKATQLTIKNVKKGQRYYVRVVPKIYVDGKVVKNDLETWVSK